MTYAQKVAELVSSLIKTAFGIVALGTDLVRRLATAADAFVDAINEDKG